MQTRDTNSDFLLIDRIAKVNTPFEFHYYVSDNPEQKVIASFDGNAYVGCMLIENSYIAVPISGESLPEGKLLIRRNFSSPNEAFVDDATLNMRYTEKTDIRLKEGANEAADVAFAFEADMWLSAKAFVAQAKMKAPIDQTGKAMEEESNKLLHRISSLPTIGEE